MQGLLFLGSGLITFSIGASFSFFASLTFPLLLATTLDGLVEGLMVVFSLLDFGVDTFKTF